MFCLKVHRSGGDVLLAGCDSDLVGRTLDHGGVEVRVRESFYGSGRSGEDEFLRMVEEATIVNIMGDRIVDLALRRGLVGEDGVIVVGGVKHAQIVSVTE